MFDTIGGPELGVLVRATPAWQNVRLYRQTIVDGEMQVLFEAIGAGEIGVFSDVVHQQGAILYIVALALTIDGHGYVCHLSPRKGVSFKCCYNKNG